MIFLLIILFLLFLLFFFLTSKFISYSKWQEKIFMIFFAIMMSIFAFFVEPPSDWDLRLHFLWMDEIRNSDLGIIQFLFKNVEGIGLSEYNSLLSFNLIRFLIARLTISNHWLPCICVFIDYYIFGYIVVDWRHTSKSLNRISPVILLLCSAFLPYYLVISGLRTALASAIAALAIYLFLYKRKNILWLIFLMFCAVTIHQVMLFTIPFIILARLEMGIKGIVYVLAISLSVNFIAPYAANSNFTFIAFIARKFLFSSSIGTPYAFLADIVLIVSFLALYLFSNRKFKKLIWKTEHKKLYMFLTYYMVFILCNIGNYDLVVRPAYILGLFAPVLVSLLDNKEVWCSLNAKKLQYAGKLLCSILCLLSLYVNVFPVIRLFIK